MAFIIFFGILALTIAVTLFTIIPILIIFFFGIPYTMYLDKAGVMKNKTPIKKELISAVILGIIFALYSWGILTFTSEAWAYGIGVGLSLVMSVGKLGRNPNNISDYLTTNKEYIDEKKLKEYKGVKNE